MWEVQILEEAIHEELRLAETVFSADIHPSNEVLKTSRRRIC